LKDNSEDIQNYMADMADFMKDIEAKDKDVTKRTKLKGVSLIFKFLECSFFARNFTYH
jgi:hypothetical protein